jgi:hypothetical protein
MAFYELFFKQNKMIQNYISLALILRGIASQCMGTLNKDKKWSAKDRSKMIKAVCGVISSQFIAREGQDPTERSWVENLENILTQSKTENVCYDFKIGLHSLDGQGSFNEALVSKIVKTLVAMSNSHAGNNYIILGVADKKQDADKHQNQYNVEPKFFSNFYITGIGDEAIKYHKNIDGYLQKLQQSLENQPITDATKRLIQRNVSSFNYYDKALVLMTIIRGDEPIKYDDRIYVRKIANTDPKPIESEKEFEFYREFIEQTNRYPYNTLPKSSIS